MIKPALSGSIDAYRSWRAVHPGVRVIYSSVFETAIGIEAALRLAALDEHCSEAVGFGTLEAFPYEDQLGRHSYGPTLACGSLTTEACEAIWKRL